MGSMSLKELFLEKVARPALTVIISFILSGIYKSSPGELRWISDPLNTFVRKFESVLVTYFGNHLPSDIMKKIGDPGDSSMDLCGWWEFDDIGQAEPIRLTEGMSVLIVGERRCGTSKNIEEGAFGLFHFVQVITPVGVLWVEEFILSRHCPKA